MSRTRWESRGPLDAEAALLTLANHTVPGLDEVDLTAGTLRRLVEVGGEHHEVLITLDAHGAIVQTPSDDRGVTTALGAGVRHWFDLDADLDPVHEVLGRDPLFAEQIARRPGIRRTRYTARFEAAIVIVLGQQVSLAAGRLFTSRLIEAFSAAPDGSGLRPFPRASAVAAADPEEVRAAIGLTGARGRTVHALAELFAAHEPAGTTPDRSEIAAVRGIGPWTMACLDLRSGDEDDAHPGSDAVLRRVLKEHGVTGPGADEAWRPYRSFATCRLWAMAGEA